MRRLAVLTALPALAATCALIPASALADVTVIRPTPIAGTERAWLGHFTNVARAGGGPVKFTVHLSQTSRYSVAMEGIAMTLTSWQYSAIRGLKVRWYDPATRHWRKPYLNEGGGYYMLGPQDSSLRIRKGQVLQVPVKVWFPKSAHPGTYRLDQPGNYIWQIFTRKGNYVPDVLNCKFHNYRVKVER